MISFGGHSPRVYTTFSLCTFPSVGGRSPFKILIRNCSQTRDSLFSAFAEAARAASGYPRSKKLVGLMVATTVKKSRLPTGRDPPPSSFLLW